MTKRIPAGYVGKLQPAAGVVRFLLSEEARYINGANIHLSGGWGIQKTGAGLLTRLKTPNPFTFSGRWGLAGLS